MIKLLFCGDFVCQSPAEIAVDSSISALFNRQDYVCVNFEAPIRNEGKPIIKSGPSLTQSSDSPKFLENLGVNLILLSNNHMMDCGKDGCEITIQSFSENTITLGAGLFPQLFDLTIIEKDSCRIGLLNLTHKEFGALGIDSMKNDYGTTWINHPLVNQIILESKSKCDKLFVLPHAGVEDIEVPLPEWRARYKEFIDLGADMIIGSHPHTPQGWEYYKGKPIFYSLGNFYFKSKSTQHNANWYNGLAIEVSIDSNKVSFIVHNTEFGDTSIRLETSKERDEFNTRLCEYLQNDTLYYEYLDDYMRKLWPTYQLYLLRGLGAFMPTSNTNTLLHAGYGLLKGKDYPLLLNNFQCESHMWAIERMIKLALQK